MKIKCICTDNRGTDCDYCGGTGWITEKISLGSVPIHKNLAEPERIWKPINPTTNIKPAQAKKTIEERIIELGNDINKTKTNAIEDTIIYLGELLKKLYFDIKRIEPKNENNKRKMQVYRNVLRSSIKLIHRFDKKFVSYKLTE